MSENATTSDQATPLGRLRHDVWTRYAMNVIAGAFTVGLFYKGITDATGHIEEKLELVTGQQGKMIEQLQRLSTAQEILAEHVKSSDRRQEDDHHRIEKLEDGKRS